MLDSCVPNYRKYLDYRQYRYLDYRQYRYLEYRKYLQYWQY
eukprot:SAG31_NODE_18884_length_619_cov_1.096154_1_plen_40_part_01